VPPLGVVEDFDVILAEILAVYKLEMGSGNPRRVKLLSPPAIAQADGACGSLPISPFATVPAF
jgi:hypothetical protein